MKTIILLPLLILSFVFTSAQQNAVKLSDKAHYETTRNGSTNKRKSILGLYDVQAGVGVITNGEMGLDFDIGATLVNLDYGSDASSTIELHYDHSRQKFDENVRYLKIQQNNLYMRIKPFTSSPLQETSAGSILAIFVGGLYVDVGYATGKFNYFDYLDMPTSPNITTHGFFWGWGWNLIWRAESQWGASLGYGSKRYNSELSNGANSKYRNRLICLGVVYSLNWKK